VKRVDLTFTRDPAGPANLSGRGTHWAGDLKAPDVIQQAKLIDRTPGAVAMRLSNFASVDPYHQPGVSED